MANGHQIQKARRVLDIEIAALRRVSRRLGPSFIKAIALMKQRLESGGKIIVTGIGKSGHIGNKIAATLASTGTTSVTLDPVDAAHGDLGVVSKKDLILVLSYSGSTDELLRVVPLFKRLGRETGKRGGVGRAGARGLEGGEYGQDTRDTASKRKRRGFF